MKYQAKNLIKDDDSLVNDAKTIKRASNIDVVFIRRASPAACTQNVPLRLLPGGTDTFTIHMCIVKMRRGDEAPPALCSTPAAIYSFSKHAI